MPKILMPPAPGQEKLFLLLSLIFGTLFGLITPPFQAVDEDVHFYRAYQVSEGGIFAEKEHGGVGGYLPKSLKEAVSLTEGLSRHPDVKYDFRATLRGLGTPLKERERVFIVFPNSAVYSPVPYLPQALGIFLGRALHFSPLGLHYCGRMLNLLAWTALVFMGLRLAPFLKGVIFALSLMPMTLFTAASLSADSVTLGLSFFLASVILYDVFITKSMKFPDMALLLITTILLSLSKQIYVVMSFMVLLIPKEKFHSSGRHLSFMAGVLLINLTVNLSWAFLVKDFIHYENHASGGEQALFVLNHLFSYCGVLLLTFFHEIRFYLVSFVGILGWYDTHLPRWFYLLFLIILALTVLDENNDRFYLRGRRKFLLLLILCLCLFLNYTALYLTFNPVGAGAVRGMQGRYFIPLTPLFALICISGKPLPSPGFKKIFHRGLTLLAPAWLLYTGLVLIGRYYLVS